MKKYFLIIILFIIGIFNSFAQVNINSASGKVKEINTDFIFKLTDKQFDKILFQSGWLTGVGDHLTLQHGGNNTLTETYGFRISDADGFNFGKNNFGSSFLKINMNGNVGIGITNPAHKLVINGNTQILDPTNADRFLFFQNNGQGNKIRSYGGSLLLETRFDTQDIEFKTNNSVTSLMKIKGNGNVGIGTTNPTSRLDILSNAGQTENLMKFRVADAPGDYLHIANSTGGANQFMPLIKGNHQSDNRFSLVLMGSTSESNDNGNNALVNFDARLPNGPVQNRPLFTWSSYSDKMMTMRANGNLGIGTNNPEAKLEVSAANDGDAILRIEADEDNNNESDNPMIQFRQDGGQLGINIGFSEENFGGNIFGIGTRYTNQESWDTFAINTETGNVGIGTTNPGAKLHVSEGVQLRKTTIGLTKASADNSWIRDEWLTGSYGPAKWSQDKKKWVRPAGQYNDIGGIVYQDEGTYFLREGLGTKLEYTNTEFLNTAFMFAHISTGNVGIGTNTPLSKMHVSNGNTGGTTHVYSDFTIEDDDHAMINLLSPNNKIGYYAFSDTQDDFVGGMQYRHGSNQIEFRVNNHADSDMTIDQNGNVGIGTTETKGYKLGVNGKIAATEVKIALYSAWPDYVFEEAYKLPTLQEVENHIETKGHLINIPSATEVTKNGIMVGEMNAKLLEKIEELTLYTIAQQKEIQKLDNENKKQQSINSQRLLDNTNLETRLEKLEVLLLKK